MENYKMLLVSFYTVVLISCVCMIHYHYKIVEREKRVKKITAFINSLETYQAENFSYFFEKQLLNSLESETNNSVLSDFKSDSLNYPANLFSFMMTHLSNKPARQFSLPIQNGSIIHTDVTVFASQKFKFSIDFIDRGDHLTIYSVQNLSAYFKYRRCLEFQPITRK